MRWTRGVYSRPFRQGSEHLPRPGLLSRCRPACVLAAYPNCSGLPTLNHGLCCFSNHGHGPLRGGLDRSNHHLCPAHVEGHGVYWHEHCNGSNHLGGAVDELRCAEHRPDAVQGLRLHAGSAPGYPNSPGAHGHLSAYRPPRLNGWHCGCQVYQLCGGGRRQGPYYHCLRCHLCGRRNPLPDPSLLVGQQHHPGVLQPAGPRGPEERAGLLALPWLGSLCSYDPRRRPTVLQLPQEGRQ